MSSGIDSPNVASKAQSLKAYIKSLRLEMQAVTWPKWTQVRSTVAVVIFTIFAFAAYLGVIDWILTKVFNRVLGLR
jgi:preprotein translocase subunit SecE